MMTRRKILLISIPLIFLLIVVSAFLYIRSDAFLNNILKSRVEKAIKEQVNEQYIVTLGELSGNIFTGIEITNVKIEDRIEKTPILATDKILLRYNFIALLKRKIVVTDLEVDSPDINIRRNSEGQVNFTQVLQDSSQKQETDESFTFAVSKVAIRGGKIVFVDTQQKIELELPNVTLLLEGPLDRWEHTAKLNFNHGSFTLNGTKLSVDPLKEIEFSISTTGGNFPEHQLKFGNSILTMKGDWKDDTWEIDAGLTFDAEDVQRFLSEKVQLEGSGKIDLDLSGTDSTLNGTLTGKSKSLSIKQLLDPTSDTPESKIREIHLTELSIDTTLELAEDPHITLNDFSLQVADGKLTGSGSATFDNTSQGKLIERLQQIVEQPITYNSQWEIADIQLPSLLTTLVELPPEAPQLESGIFSGTVNISGKSTENFHIDSGVQLSDMNLLVTKESGQSIPFSMNDSSLNCKISSEPESGSNITADGNIDSIKVEINGSSGTFDVELSHVDFGKLFDIFTTTPFKGIGSVTVQVKDDGTATGYAEIPKAYYNPEEIPIGRLAGNFRYKDGVVFFENTNLTKIGDKENANSRVSIDGNVKMEGELPANFRIAADPLVLDADYNRLFFSQDYPIEGSIRGVLNVHGTLTHLDGEGQFTINSGKAWNINLDPATLPLKIDDYALTISNFVITTRGQEVVINTHVSNTGDFDFSLKNSKDNPVQISELALAADIPDFPLDGKMDVVLLTHQKKPENVEVIIDLDFSNLTFNGNPLGDASLEGVLVEQSNSTQEPDYYRFTGKAFENTSSIEGIISNATDNPYQFVIKNEKTAVTPILRIFNPVLDAITGTANGTVTVKGTIAELAPTGSLESSEKRVYPYDVDIVINDTELQYDSHQFTNPSPIRIQLEDDLLTITDSSLTVRGVKDPLIQLFGTIDAKTEIINISTQIPQNLNLNTFGEKLGLPIKGKVHYDLNIKGPLSDPVVDLNWNVPTLHIETDIGDIGISDAKGELTYQNNVVFVKPSTMQILNNPFEVSGNIVFDPTNVDNSQLNFDLRSSNINLLKFSDLAVNSLSNEMAKRLMSDKPNLIEGNVDLSLSIAGTVLQPEIDLNLNTIEGHPILLGAMSKPIILGKLQAVTTIGKQSVYIKDIVANGQIGEGNLQINGHTSFTYRNHDEMTFDMGVLVEKIEIGNFVDMILQNPSIVNGTVSGTGKFSGTGITPDLIDTSLKVDELNLQVYNSYEISNVSPIDFKLADNSMASFIPLQVRTSALDSTINFSIAGPLTSPNLLGKLHGTLKTGFQKDTNSTLQLQGNIEYVNKQVQLGIQLTNNGDSLTLKGMVPFDLTLSEIDLIDRFIDTPMNVNLTGKELPLTFIPGFEQILAESEGVVDIDLTLQGSTRSPYLQGSVFFTAPIIRFNTFNQPIENINVHLNARKDVIEFVKFQFGIEDGTCNLEHGELKLDGLIPKLFVVEDLSFEGYPLGSTLRQIIPQDLISDIEGSVTATLRELSIPFNSFIEIAEDIPIPQLRQPITFDALTQEANVEITIDDVSLGFVTWDQHYNFNNPQSIPISLDAGEFKVEGLKLENTTSIPSEATDLPLVFTCYGRWNMHGDIFVNLGLKNFNISALHSQLSALNLQDYDLNGMLSTQINILGPYSEPVIEVMWKGHGLRINQAEIDEFLGELTYNYTDRQWIIDKTTLLRLGNNRIFCSGRVPHLLSLSELRAKPLSEEMEIIIDMQLTDLEVLSRIQPFIQSADGKGIINATISGTPTTPRLTGTGRLDEIDLQFDQSPVSFENTNFQFNFSESQLFLESIGGRLSDGDYSAKGDITLNWFKVDYIDLNVNMDKCVFVEPGQYKAEVSTGAKDLHLYGTLSEPTLEGDLIIHSGEYEQNWENVRDWFSGATVSDLEVALRKSFLGELELDISVDIPDNFHFLSSVGGPTNIEITCNGRLIGPIQEPIFKGDVFLHGGQISFPTQTFEIDPSSRISNLSETNFNPELNILLQLRNPIRGVVFSDGSTADIMLTASITGTLEDGAFDKAETTFQAIPLNSSTTEVLTEADILTLLLPDNSFSRSLWGIVFTISSGLDPNERHIIADIPVILFGRKMSIKMEGDEKGEYGVDVQLLERRF